MTDTWDRLRATEQPRPRRELISSGATRHALDHHRVRTSHGLYRAAVEESVEQRIVDAAALLPPGAVIGGWVAARLHGATAFDGRSELTLDPLPVTLFLPPGQRRRDIPGVRYRQATEKLDSIDVVGIPVTPVLLTASHLAQWADDLAGAVVALDALLYAGVVSHGLLVSALGTLSKGRGVVQARGAAELCRCGVRSPGETRLRLCCELDAGYPPLLVNQPVHTPDGTLLAVPDLLDAEAGVAVEYDGATWLDGRGHREAGQHREDNVREEVLERAGLIVVRADRADVMRHRPQLRRRLVAARRQGLARDRSRDRWILGPTAPDNSPREGGTR